MPDLYCEASNCAHNKNRLCSIDNITVSGKTAVRADGTCCENFTEQTTPESLINKGEKKTFIDCYAENCRYNEDLNCYADSVNICGEEACRCKETECKTFSKKK